MAALSPATKARRVFKAEVELAKAVRKDESWDEREAKARKALEAFTPEKREQLANRVAVAEKALNYQSLAPVKDDDEAAYEEELNRLRTEATPEVDDDESDAS